MKRERDRERERESLSTNERGDGVLSQLGDHCRQLDVGDDGHVIVVVQCEHLFHERPDGVPQRQRVVAVPVACPPPPHTNTRDATTSLCCRWRVVLLVKKGKVFPYSIPSVGPGADTGVQAVAGVAGRRQLRSASRRLLNFPRYNVSNYGRRAFCFAGPYVWNSLPEHIRQST